MFKGKIDLSMLSSIDYEEYISLKDCLKYRSLTRYNIPICLGRDENGEILIKDMVGLQNLLLCGVTGTGKSVFIHSFINTILLSKTSKDVKFIMIDPKISVEMLAYNGIPHLLHPVITDPDEAYEVFSWCLEEIERRKESNIKKPSIVIVIDEFSDVMLADQDKAIRLETIVKNGNEVGIYTLLSTSIPSERIVTDTLQKYIYARMAGSLMTAEYSKTVIGEAGAQNLSCIGGDMIFKNKNTGEMIRVQAPYISTEEQERVLKTFSKKNGNKDIKIQNQEGEIDPLFEEGKKVVKEYGFATAPLLHRKLEIGWDRAARLLEQLEQHGIVAKQEGTNRRKVLI